MTSDRQIAANARNALKSTGPRTTEGKAHSSRNAFRHGLTAETVIGSLEQAAQYRKLESALFDEYEPATATEEALVSRLASLLWRIRRATQIESGLFEMVKAGRSGLENDAYSPALAPFYSILTKSASEAARNNASAIGLSTPSAKQIRVGSIYRKLSKSPGSLKTLGRYETALWRQFAQTLLLLQSTRSSKRIGSRFIR